jgi:hypothetical protein
VKFGHLFAVVALICVTVACGLNSLVPPASTPACDLKSAAELISITASNNGAADLSDYPVAVPIHARDFDFNLAAADGSDLSAWDSQGAQIPHWVESYDPVLGDALVWVKWPFLAHQGSAAISLTAGGIARCPLSASNGYQVFPFFSDVPDMKNWQTSGGEISVSNTITASPLTSQQRQIIESDGMYNSTPSVVTASNGDWLLSYRKGTAHVNSPLVVLRRSQDGEQTWSPEAAYFNTSHPDPTLAKTPGGDLMIEFAKQDPNGITGAAYARSTDNGLTWNPFTFFDQPVSNSSAFPTAFLNLGQLMYAASYGPSTVGTGNSPFLWSSSDDGHTWSKISELRQGSEPGLNETAITETAPGELFAMSRTDNSLDTYGRFSEDMGVSWGPLISYTAQFGVIQLPQLVPAGSALATCSGRIRSRTLWQRGIGYSGSSAGQLDWIPAPVRCLCFLRCREKFQLWDCSRHLHRSTDRWWLLMADVVA